MIEVEENSSEEIVVEIDDSLLDPITVRQDLEIKISQKTLNSSVINLTWCITPQLMNKIKESDESYYILFTVVKHEMWWQHDTNNYEHRVAVPLSDLMAYIPVDRPGNNYIVATVVEARVARDMLVRSRYDNNYIFNSLHRIMPSEIINLEEQGIDLLSVKPNLGDTVKNSMPTPGASDIISIDIPKEAFAKAPPQWEQTWVNYMFDSLRIGKSFDQCSFRRRRLVAYPFMLVWSTLMIGWRFLVALFWVSMGVKIKPKAVYNYFKYSWGDVFESHLNSANSKWNVIPFVQSDWKYLGAVFTPAFWLLYLGISILAGNLYDFWIGVGIMICIALIIVFAIYMCETFKISDPFNWLMNKINKYLDERNAKNIQELENSLVCNGQEFKSLEDLPRHLRTTKLRFQEMKSQVCKPFAK